MHDDQFKIMTIVHIIQYDFYYFFFNNHAWNDVVSMNKCETVYVVRLFHAVWISLSSIMIDLKRKVNFIDMFAKSVWMVCTVMN